MSQKINPINDNLLIEIKSLFKPNIIPIDSYNNLLLLLNKHNLIIYMPLVVKSLYQLLFLNLERYDNPNDLLYDLLIINKLILSHEKYSLKYNGGGESDFLFILILI